MSDEQVKFQPWEPMSEEDLTPEELEAMKEKIKKMVEENCKAFPRFDYLKPFNVNHESSSPEDNDIKNHNLK